MIETSATTAKLDEALAKAQNVIDSAAKDSENPHFRSKYADLASIWHACRDALSANGIAVTQWLVHRDDNRLGIVTRLACSGEWMQAMFSIPVSKPDAHGYGSAATYARRYALAAAVGVVADEDDDANAAVQKPPPKKGPAPGERGHRGGPISPERGAPQSVELPSKVSDAPVMTADQLEGWQMEITLAESLGLDALRGLAKDMGGRLTPQQRKALEGSFRSAERRAKERAAKAIAEGKPADGAASRPAEPPPVVGGEAA